MYQHETNTTRNYVHLRWFFDVIKIDTAAMKVTIYICTYYFQPPANSDYKQMRFWIFCNFVDEFVIFLWILAIKTHLQWNWYSEIRILYCMDKLKANKNNEQIIEMKRNVTKVMLILTVSMLTIFNANEKKNQSETRLLTYDYLVKIIHSFQQINF